MNKVKAAVLLLLGASLALFTYQNWTYPSPSINFLIFTLPLLPYSALIFACLLIGFVCGWAARSLRVRRAERQAPASPADSP